MNQRDRPVVRFAPSPNGYLHLGHALSALICKDWAKALGGRLLLRIEDTDLSRARSHYVDAIYEDLAWLGLTWEEPVRVQSQHLERYETALRDLYAKGFAYPAPASRTHIARALENLKAEGIDWPSDPDGTTPSVIATGKTALPRCQPINRYASICNPQ